MLNSYTDDEICMVVKYIAVQIIEKKKDKIKNPRIEDIKNPSTIQLVFKWIEDKIKKFKERVIEKRIISY